VQTLASAVDHSEEARRACFSLANAVPAEGELLASPWKPADCTTTATLKGAPGKGQRLFELGAPNRSRFSNRGNRESQSDAEIDRAAREQAQVRKSARADHFPTVAFFSAVCW